MHILGVDVGGSGIKGAIVDTETGEFVSERHRIETPQPATPNAVADVLSQLVSHFNWTGPVGCGFPAVIQYGTARTAANLSDDFIGVCIDHLFSEASQCNCYCINDADAAGLAEMRFGKGMGRGGVVVLVTVGTGLGTALFTDGILLPNTELGHMFMSNGKEAEHYASDAVRKREELGWNSWGKRLNKYLGLLEDLLWPDVILLGGGVSKKFDKFNEQITIATPVIPASLLNQAGIVGAALFAESKFKQATESTV